MQRARDGRCREREHVNVDLYHLEPFLVLDAEALLFVNNEQAEVFEPDLWFEQRVRADDDVDFARGQAFENVALLGGRAETVQHIHGHGEQGEALAERAAVLLGEDGCRRENGHLLFVEHGFERGAQSHLGFAVAHIAVYDTVHGARLFHVGLHRVDGSQLVVGFIKGERVLEFLHEKVIAREGVAVNLLALGIKRVKRGGHVLDLFLYFAFHQPPARRMQGIDFWRSAL